MHVEEQFVGFESFTRLEAFGTIVWVVGEERFGSEAERFDLNTKRSEKARKTPMTRSLRFRGCWVFGLMFSCLFGGRESVGKVQEL